MEMEKKYVELPSLPDPSVFEKCIELYGKDNQIDMAIEEMSELSKALLKERRARKRGTNSDIIYKQSDVVEEMADVIIMLTQLLMIFGNTDALVDTLEFKTKRQAVRVAKELERRKGQENKDNNISEV